MAIETFAPQAGATPLRIRRVQKITLTLLFIAGIVNFLDRSSLSVAGEAIRADLGLSATEFKVLLVRSTLGQRRPIDDEAILADMVANAALTVSARDETGLLVGIARSVTDFA